MDVGPTEEKPRETVEGIAAMTTTSAEIGTPDDQIRSEVVGLIHHLGLEVTPGLLRAVATTVSRQPQPVNVPANERASLQFFEQLVGVASAEKQLNSALRVMAVMEELADSLEAAGPAER